MEETKSSKDSKKSSGSESGKGPSLVFKITSKVPYKTVMKGASTAMLILICLFYFWTAMLILICLFYFLITLARCVCYACSS